MTNESGVFYQTEDYLGVGKRLLIDAVDTFVAVVVSLICTALLILVWPHEQSLPPVAASAWALIWAGYFVLLKRSRYRTLGYRAAGARIVNLQGETPSISSLVIRLLFVVAGPGNFLFDLLWISSDECRQAIRDKFAHTYVVRSDSVPIGSGRIVYRTYNMLGATFNFQEILRPSTSGAP